MLRFCLDYLAVAQQLLGLQDMDWEVLIIRSVHSLVSAGLFILIGALQVIFLANRLMEL